MTELLSETEVDNTTEQTTVPHNTSAEEVILGSVFKRPEVIAQLADLPAADFYQPRYRTIWQAMLDLWHRNTPVDYATVGARLQAPDMAAARIGISDLALIDLSIPSPAHAEHYARLVMNSATQRRYISASQTIAEKFWPNGVDVDEMAQQAEALLAAARPRRSRRDLYDPQRWAETFMADLEARADGKRTAVETGLMDVNRMTLGLEAGGLYLLMATPGSGKALALDTLLPTLDGWVMMGDVRVGDTLFDEKGLPCRVTWTSGAQLARPCYEVVFSDGSTIVADADHRWVTKTDPERKYPLKRVVDPTTNRSAWQRLPLSCVRTTAQIAATLKRSDGGLNHSIDVAGPLASPEVDLPIDPYVLGAWLGDGSSYRADITIADEEIAEQFAAVGHRMTLRKQPPEKTPAYGVADLHLQLQRLGLYANKHIPMAYQRAGIPQRLALLQGLMDTDGYCGEGGVAEFSSTRQVLAMGVYELVCSLGIKATVRMKPCKGRRPETSTAYAVCFTTDLPVFRLTRKLARQNRTVRATQQRRYIVAVRPVDSVPVQCIQVDSPSHQFLASQSCIPTHNTELAMQIGIHVAKNSGAVLFASLEMTAIELAHRYARITHGLDRNKLAKGALDDLDSKRAMDAMNAMVGSKFWPASPTAQYTTADLRADALEVRAKAGHVALIVADYVQRFRDRSTRTSTREENVGLVAENLKSLAREFGCPVLAPVQPNREYVGRSNKRPVLSDLRESGKLEQEADVVLGLYRDEKHSDDPDRRVAELHMLKNRSGVGDAEGVRKLRWLGNRYGDYTAEQQPEGAWAA